MLSTRQKSCKACVKAKRRCDLGLPACERCLARDVSCEYPWTDLVNNSPLPCLGPQDSSWVTEPSGSRATQLANPIETISSIPQPLSPAMVGLLSDVIGNGRNSYPNDAFTTAALRLGPLPTLQPLATEEVLITARDRFQARTEYAGRRLATQAIALAQSGQTAFIHHTQVGSSALLQEALAASALHAMRNPANVGIVKSEIARRATLLIDAVEKVLTQSLTVELDLLPPVQALLIYQCIRLFSILDITQQAQAERDAMYLSSWATRLQSKILPFNPSASWLDWVRQESIRRTVLFAEILTGVYTFLKYRWDSGESTVANLGFTAQAALWEARSTTEWQRAWSRLPRLELTVSTFGCDTKDAKPDDFDELGMLFRVTFTGLDAFEEWLGGDKAILNKWGLGGNSMLPAY